MEVTAPVAPNVCETPRMEDTADLTQQQREIKQRCIERAGQILSEGYRVLYFAPLDEAARAAMHPGGPPFDELKSRIAEARARDLPPELLRDSAR